MVQNEFKTQHFKTPEQWGGGLFCGLQALKEGGVCLYAVPVPGQWLKSIDGVEKPRALAADFCGQLYVMDSRGCVYRYDLEARVLEKLFESDVMPGDTPARMCVSSPTLWIVDREHRRILGYSREHFQLIHVIDKVQNPADIALSSRGNLYALDAGTKKISLFDTHGQLLLAFGDDHLKEPIALAAGKDDALYVLDVQEKGFVTFTEKGDFLRVAGDLSELRRESGALSGFKPSVMAIAKDGNVFVAEEKGEVIFQFDPEGSFVGKITLTHPKGFITSIASGPQRKIYVCVSDGLSVLEGGQTFGKKGYYYSQTLDSGIEGCQWHRLVLKAEIPAKALLKVSYHSSDDKEEINNVLTAPEKWVQVKAQYLNTKIQWTESEDNPDDMLLLGKGGRYLWLRIGMTTFDETVSPSVTEMRVVYPRITYLRYLPAIYQDVPLSREFLERFLSLFESVLWDLEADISNVIGYLDPDTTPVPFLSWLASWLNRALEEEWQDDKKREFIRQAPTLYKQKGTPAGLSRLLSIYTGKAPVILEDMNTAHLTMLGGQARLGVDSVLIQTPVRGFRLGDDSILGRVALRDKDYSPDDPFLPLAHRFTVIVDFSHEELISYEKGLRRILDEEKPAHTAYTLRAVREMRVGLNSYVELNARVGDYRPITLGQDSILGAGIIAFDSGEQVGKVERRSKVGVDTRLI